jgi:hypothetical protein
VRRLPGPAGDGGDSRGSLRFVSGLAENINSIFGADSSESQTANWMSGSAESRNHQPRGTVAQRRILIGRIARSPKRAFGELLARTRVRFEPRLMGPRTIAGYRMFTVGI